MVILWFVPSCLLAQFNEDVIKAAYIERITRFVEWPQRDQSHDTTVFVIGVFGDRDFLKILKESLKNKTIKGKIVEILELKNLTHIELCDICYITGIDDVDITQLVTSAIKSGVLIMAEKKGYGEKGIHLNFYIEENKLKFEINKSSVDTGKFRISSMLMKSSKII